MELEKQLRVLKKLWQLFSLTIGWIFLESFVICIAFAWGKWRGMILFPDYAQQIYGGTVCEILGEKLVKCLQSLVKLPVSPKQKSFWKKYHAPSLAIWEQGQLRGITQTHTESFSQNDVTTFGY